MRKKITIALLAACLVPTMAFAYGGYHNRGGNNGGGYHNGNGGWFHKGGGNGGYHNNRGGACWGQGSYGRHQGMMGDYNLSAEQQQKLDNLRWQQRKAHQDIYNKHYNLSDTETATMRAEHMKIAEDSDKAVRAILTPEQQKRFDEANKWRTDRDQEWQEFQQWKAQKAK